MSERTKVKLRFQERRSSWVEALPSNVYKSKVLLYVRPRACAKLLQVDSGNHRNGVELSIVTDTPSTFESSCSGFEDHAWAFPAGVRDATDIELRKALGCLNGFSWKEILCGMNLLASYPPKVSDAGSPFCSSWLLVQAMG